MDRSRLVPSPFLTNNSESFQKICQGHSHVITYNITNYTSGNSGNDDIFVFKCVSYKWYKRWRKNECRRCNKKIISINSEYFCQNKMKDERSKITPCNKSVSYT